MVTSLLEMVQDSLENLGLAITALKGRASIEASLTKRCDDSHTIAPPRIGELITQVRHLSELTLWFDTVVYDSPDQMECMFQDMIEILQHILQSPLKDRLRVAVEFVNYSLSNTSLITHILLSSSVLRLQTILLGLPLLEPLVFSCKESTYRVNRIGFWDHDIHTSFPELSRRGRILINYPKVPAGEHHTSSHTKRHS